MNTFLTHSNNFCRSDNTLTLVTNVSQVSIWFQHITVTISQLDLTVACSWPAMPGMGLCCQRLSENKETLKHRWPSGSCQEAQAISSPLSPRGSMDESLAGASLEEDDEESSSPRLPFTNSSSNYLQVLARERKSSRTSTSSGRSSVVSIVSVQSAAHLARMSSLGGPTSSTEHSEVRRKTRRAVSLKLPSRHRNKSHDGDTKVPTIYVDDPPSGAARRKSSLQKAMSLLAVTPSEPRPVQKILRQPTRRQHVRGISGLPIATQEHSRQTLYYPTNVPVRTRRTSTSLYM